MSFVDQLSSTSRLLFIEAGWSADRIAPQRVRVGSSAAALADELLAEFDRLRVGSTGAGSEFVASDIRFFSRFASERERMIQSRFPVIGDVASIGSAHNDHVSLFVNGRGNLLAFTDPDSRLYIAGESVAEGVDRLLLGDKWDFPWKST